MYDLFERKINYLRVSVTDLCNLRCQYCMPEEGVQKKCHDDILSLEEIVEIVKIAVKQGISKVRLTGGEPLVRKGIESLVKMLSGIDGIHDLSMTTNGILLTKYAEKLKKAGLHRLNISLDTLNPDKYKKITKYGNLDQVLEGIETAKRCGFRKIKINTVISQFIDDSDIESLKKYASENNFEIRFIREMDRETGDFWPVENGDGGKCSQCNRLRLSNDGFLHPCLFSKNKYSIREHGTEKALQLALENKPISGKESNLKGLYTIGG